MGENENRQSEAEDQQTDEDVKTPAEAETEAGDGDQDEDKAAEKSDAKDPESDDAEGEGKDGEDDADKPKPKKKSPLRQHIKSLEERERAAKQREQEAIRRAERAERALQRLQNPAPRPEDFDSNEDYQAELAAYKVDQRRKAEVEDEAKEAKADAEAAAKEVNDTSVAKYRERVTDFLDEAGISVSDFEKAVNDIPVGLSRSIQSEIVNSELGPQITLFLGRHPAEAKRIGTLDDPVAAAREIGRIEARLSAPPVRKTTQAPKPVATEAKGAGSRERFDPQAASVDDYFAKRKSGWQG